MPETLYNFICKDQNTKAITKIKVKFQHAVEVINLFIEDESIGTQEQQLNTLKEFLIKNAKVYQFIFGNLFPRCFARIDDYSIQSKIAFNSHYKNYLAQKNVFEWERKNLFWSSLNDNDEKNEITDQNSTPLNMTTLNDDKDTKKEIKDDENEVKIITLGKKNKKLKKEEIAKLKKKEIVENKIKKRNEKKRKLEEKLVENTKKLQKTKKSKINK